jgi:hypothetical protein
MFLHIVCHTAKYAIQRTLRNRQKDTRRGMKNIQQLSEDYSTFNEKGELCAVSAEGQLKPTGY